MTRSALFSIRPLAAALAPLAVLALLGGCSFDTSGLDERLCTTAIDCPIGQTCTGGICIGTATGDADLDGGSDTDSGEDDVGLDVPFDTADATDAADATPDVGPDAGECEPGTATCEGNVVLACGDDATIERINCLSVSNCPDGEFGCYCDAGACEPRICSPGTSRCADDATVETCNARGDAWEASASCTDDEICIGDACVDRLCEADTRTCSGETIVVCDAIGQIDDTIDCLAEDAWCDDRGDDPICTPRVCTPGETRCAAEGEAVETCDGRGTAFEAPVPCEGATYCDDGLCVDQVCEPGAAGCLDAFRYEICDARGADLESVTCDDGDYCDDSGDLPTCLPQACDPGTTICAAGREAVRTCTPSGAEYSDAVDCGDEQFCSGGVCNAWVCTPGERTCDGLFAIRTCDARGAGVTLTTCAEGRYCDDDGAAPTCAPQVCVPGTTRCSDGGVSTCNDAGSGFDDPVDCGGDQVCIGGDCEDVVCEAGSRTCTDGFTRSVCNATGTTLTTERCGAAQYCAGGACFDQTCTPGETTCFGTTGVQTCNEFGSAVSAEACGDARSCRDGACFDQICEPSSTVCADAGTVTTCSADGLDETDTDCGASETCDDGTCTPWVCTPDTSECLDESTVGTCSADGLAVTSSTCDAGFSCEAGACVEDSCAFGTTSCVGDDLYRCTGEGDTFVRTCALGCSDGACIAGCGDGVLQAGEACDDGNDEPCDGCDACAIDGAMQLTASSVTTAPANWTPARSDITLEAWVQVTTAGNLVGVGEAGFDHFLLGVDGSGRPFVSLSLDPGQSKTITAPDSIIDGDWHHIAGVRYDQDVVWLYVDGQFVAANNVNLTSSSIDRGQIWFGDYASEPGISAAALVGDVRISNTRRYFESFAPPRAHANDASTIAAFRLDGSTVAGAANRSWASVSGTRTVIVSSTAASAACYGGTSDAIVCGDGNLAPWEVCDGGADDVGCNDECFIQCNRSVGPFHNCYDWNITPLTWNRWDEVCTSRGADLITIDNVLEDYWVRLWVADNFDSAPFWIGLNDIDTEDEFRWVSGADSTYRAWATGEPNDSPPGEDCAQLIPGFGWNDLACSTEVLSICEYPTD